QHTSTSSFLFPYTMLIRSLAAGGFDQFIPFNLSLVSLRGRPPFHTRPQPTHLTPNQYNSNSNFHFTSHVRIKFLAAGGFDQFIPYHNTIRLLSSHVHFSTA